MKAVILAGGKGTRVRPLTYIVPKPMVPIIDRPLMSILIDLLKKHGFDEIVVTVGYLAGKIEEYFRNGVDYGVYIAYSLEGKVVKGELVPMGLGSAGGLKKVQDFSGFFDEDFLVLCGDAIIDLDLTKVMEFHKARQAVATVVLKEVPKEEVYRYGVVVTANDGRVVKFQEKPKVEEALSNTINTGIYVFNPRVFDYIPSGKEYDIGKDLLPRLVEAKEPFYGINIPFQWLDIGTTPDYFKTILMVLEGKVNGVKPYGKEVRPGVWVGINTSIDFSKVEIVPPVYIGGSVKIEEGVKIIGPAVIGAGCIVEAGAYIEKSIIMDYTKVSGIAHLTEKIVAGKYFINPFGTSLDIEETDMGWIVDDARKEAEELSEEQRAIIELISSTQ
jgi:mannose-1-phosphate guanylyltransferase